MDNPIYASVLNLDRKAVRALKITDPYSVHRVVYSLFKDVRTDDEKNQSTSSGILYHDQGGSYTGRQILIMSDRIPSLNIDGYGRVETKKINPPFLAFDHYRFKVMINPCRRNNKTRKLIPVKGREDIAQWFIQRSEQSWGFNAANSHLQVNGIEVLRFKGKNQRSITIAQACLEGVLKVTDRDKFIPGFRQGIGRARAFGCGLLQIVPLSNNATQ